MSSECSHSEEFTDLLCVWRWLKRGKRLQWIFVVVVIGIFIWRCLYLLGDAGVPYVMVTFPQSTVQSEIQLYYDRGYGFNEHDSTVQDEGPLIKKKWGVLPDVFQKNNKENDEQFFFEIPADKFHGFKLLIHGNEVTPSEIKIVNGLGGLLHLVPSNVLKHNDIIFEDIALTSDRKGQYQVLNIVLDPIVSVSMQKNIFSIPGYLLSIGVELIFLVVFISGFVFLKTILGDNILLRKVLWKCIYTLQNFCGSTFIFIFLSSIYFYCYSFLNDRQFPLIFEKTLFVLFFLIVISYYIIKKDEASKVHKLLVFSGFFLLLLFISTFMHYWALSDSNVIKLLSIIDTGGLGGVLIDRYKALQQLIDNRVTTDQASFMFFFPLLLLVNIIVFQSSKSSLRLLKYLPLIFLPNLFTVFYQIIFQNLSPFQEIGLTGDCVHFRSLLFLLFPLSFLGLVTSGKRWEKTLHLLSSVMILILVPWTQGRGLVLGIGLFISSIPIINIWIRGESRRVRDYVYLSLPFLLILLMFVGFSVPKFKGVMENLFSKRVVNTINYVRQGDWQNSLLSDRTEMQTQVVRLINEAPIGGRGTAAFQRHSARVRYINREPQGIEHVMVSLYLQMISNFGIIGFLSMMTLHLFPLFMILRVKKKISSTDNKWAIGIAVSTVVIMLLLFNTNPHISIPVVNWIYCAYLGYLAAEALKYGFASRRVGTCSLAITGTVGLIMFIVANYKTSFGSAGYKNIERELFRRINLNKTITEKKELWSSKKDIGSLAISNKLVHTTATIFRNKYTTNVFNLQGRSQPIQYRGKSDLGCIRTTIGAQSQPGNIYITQEIWYKEVNGIERRLLARNVFHTSGVHYNYFSSNLLKDNQGTFEVTVDMWKALSYHQDLRTIFDQSYNPLHKDYSDIDIVVDLLAYSSQPKDEKK